MVRAIAVRVHTVASFDESGEGVDYRQADMTVKAEDEGHAIVVVEGLAPDGRFADGRVLTGIEFLSVVDEQAPPSVGLSDEEISEIVNEDGGDDESR